MNSNLARYFLFLLILFTLVACGGGGGSSTLTVNNSMGSGTTGGGSTGGGSTGGGSTGGGSTGGGSTGGNLISPVNLNGNQGQALLGPIVDAAVSVYLAENFNGVEICSVMTSSVDSEDGPGIIDLSDCPIDPEIIYFLVIRGGMDIDVDDDGVLDNVPTAKNGALRALLKGEDIISGDFRVNIVTELAYQNISDALLTGETAVGILNRLNNIARQLLTEDINNDGVIDNTDLLSFSPVEDSEAIVGENAEILEGFLAAILSGDRKELTNLARQYFLSSTAEFYYQDLIGNSANFQNLLISEIMVESNILYVLGFEADSAEFDLKLFVFDIDDFSDIRLLGQLEISNLPSNPQSGGLNFLKYEEMIYVVSQGSGLFGINVSDLTSPQNSFYYSAENYFSIEQGPGSLLYIGAFDFSVDPSIKVIYVFDASNKENPSIVNSINGYTAFDMHYEDERLYVYGNGLQVFEALESGSLSNLGGSQFPTGSSGESDVLVYKDGYVYLPMFDYDLANGGLAIFDVRNSSNIIRSDFITGVGTISGIYLQDNLIYVASAFDNMTFTNINKTTLSTYEIPLPGDIELVDSRSAPMTFSLETTEDFVFLSSSTDFIAYLKEALNNNVEHLNQFHTSRAASNIQIINDIAFIVNETTLLSIDVSDPEGELSILDEIKVGNSIISTDYQGDYVYLGQVFDGIKVIDISDPSNMQIIGSYPETNELGTNDVIEILVNDGYVYAVSSDMIDVYDVSVPSTPELLIDESISIHLIRGAAKKGNAIYFSSGSDLSTFNVSDATHPFQVKSQSLISTSLEVEGNFLYATTDNAGLSILGISDELNPVLFGGSIGLGIGNNISVVGDIAYVANEFGTVDAYDISDKTDPVLIGVYPMHGVVRDVYGTGDYIFAVNGFGLVIAPAVNASVVAGDIIE